MRNASDVQQETPPPPRFSEARNTRQKARASGMDPDRWYAVEYDKAIKNGEVKEITFWNQSIAVFRGEDGVLAAVQNRCPHRHLKLSHGAVDRCQLRCAYHGWSFNRDGWLTDYSHDSFGKSLIKHQLRAYPIQVLYGLIWIFPGAAEKAHSTQPPRIPELLGDDPWAGFTVDYTWKTHHSMVIDNICDFAHAFLHRKYQPFVDAKLTHYETDDNRVYLTYDTFMAEGKISRYFVNRKRVNTRSIEICYEYPYQWSNTGDSIKHYCFLLPIDESTTRVFFVFYFDSVKIPLIAMNAPKWLTQLVLNASVPLLFKPLLAEDGVALEAEQIGYETHWDAPPIELNPVVPLLQKLTVQKWQEYLDRESPTLLCMASQPAA
jgi:phenylpropionate dioxygenase-like ring-hydroxylating dioxygenase large terminal subunit